MMTVICLDLASVHYPTTTSSLELVRKDQNRWAAGGDLC